MAIQTPPVPSEMTAIAITRPGPPHVLQPQKRPTPTPKDRDGVGEILIKVAAAGVNRPDALQRAGHYAPPPDASDLPGLEVCGTVVGLSPTAERWHLGDMVTALVPGGGYAEYVTAPWSHALPVPDGLTVTEAAGLPETYFTVWTNVFMRGGLKAGETFLVHGGSSGIGTTAIQLAKAAGACVIATAGSAAKCQTCQALGADLVINYRSEDYVKEIASFTKKRGVDLILDMVGGDYVDRNYQVAALDGRIVQIAFLSGAVAEANFARLMTKRLTHTGSTLRPQSVAAKAQIAEALETHVWPDINAGRIRPIIQETLPLTEAARAHSLMETSPPIGKIILQVRSG